MQLLSRTKTVDRTDWGYPTVMSLRPNIAVKIAQSIAAWAEIEAMLGIFIALLLHANGKAILSIYSALENRAAQLKMINSASLSTLPSEHYDAISVLVTAEIKPAMRYRDKLAHWCWGYSDELPDALLIREPSFQLESLALAIQAQGVKGSEVDIPLKHDTVFVLKEADLDRFLKQLSDAQHHLQLAMGSVWSVNNSEQRAEHLRQLSDTPHIRSGLARLATNRQNNQATQQPSPPPDQSGGT